MTSKTMGIGAGIILVILIIYGSCVSSEARYQESKYQESINAIKAKNWDEAEKIILLADKNYKDSKALYSYIASQKSILEQKYSLAGFQASEIPDSYNGEFKDEILAFKKEAVDRASKLTPEQIDAEHQRTAEKIKEDMTKESLDPSYIGLDITATDDLNAYMHDNFNQTSWYALITDISVEKSGGKYNAKIKTSIYPDDEGKAVAKTISGAVSSNGSINLYTVWVYGQNDRLLR